MANYNFDAYIDYHEEGCQSRLARLEEANELAYWASYGSEDGQNAVVITNCPGNQLFGQLTDLIEAVRNAAKRHHLHRYEPVTYFGPIPEQVLRMMIDGSFNPSDGQNS